jgi:hypothetical protein
MPTRRAPGDLFVGADLLSDLLADALHRVERGHRVLRDQRDPLPPDLAQRALPDVQEVDAVKARHAAEADVGRAGQSHQRHARDGLTGARFAHHTEHLAGVHEEAHLVDGVNHALVGHVVDAEPVDLEEVGHQTFSWMRGSRKA